MAEQMQPDSLALGLGAIWVVGLGGGRAGWQVQF